MQSFVIDDAIRFRLATQQDDTGAKIQVFFGVFAGVILRWILIDIIQRKVPWMFGVIIARLVVALIVTIFVFSGYWQKVKDQSRLAAFSQFGGIRGVDRCPGRSLDLLGGGENQLI